MFDQGWDQLMNEQDPTVVGKQVVSTTAACDTDCQHNTRNMELLARMQSRHRSQQHNLRRFGKQAATW